MSEFKLTTVEEFEAATARYRETSGNRKKSRSRCMADPCKEPDSAL